MELIKLLYITNIPTLYRNRRFNVMSDIFKDYKIEFEVLYMAEKQSNRSWIVPKESYKYNYKIFKGIHPGHKNTFFHLNPGLLFRLRKSDYNVAIVGGFTSPTQWLVPLFLKKTNLNILSVESNLDSTQFKSGIGYNFKKMLTNQYDAYQITGKRSKDYLEWLEPNVNNKPFIVMPNVVDENIFINKIDELKKERDSLRNKFRVSSNEQMWICPARLENVKGLHLFLPLLKGIDGIKLFIAGDGELRKDLQNIIDDEKLKVTLEGFKNQDELVEYYAAADLFVLPSLKDPSPLSPIEACAASLPILVSDRIGNYEDVLEIGVNGWGIDIKGDKTENTNLLKKISEINNSQLLNMGIESRKRFMNIFETTLCVNNFAKQVRSIYESFTK